MNVAFTKNFLPLLSISLLAGAGLMSSAPPAAAQVQKLSTVTDVSLNDIGIEVTQGIQNKTHSVMLLGGRRTIVRVYLNVTSDKGFGQITGTLRLTPIAADGTRDDAVEITNPINGSASIFDNWKNKLDVVRKYAMASLNFELPMNLVVKGKKYELKVAELRDTYNGSRAIPCGNCANKSVTIEFKEEAPTFRLEVLGLAYKDATGNTIKPRQVDYDVTKSWFPRAYPIGTFTFGSKAVDTGKTFSSSNGPDCFGDKGRCLCETLSPDKKTCVKCFDCCAANTKVAAVRTLDIDGGKMDYRTHYYGMVSDKTAFMRGCVQGTVPEATPSPSKPASGPSGPAPITFSAGKMDFDSKESYAGWYAGHEIGHSLGRKHVDCGGATGTDGNYPFDGGKLAAIPAEDGKRYVGFDMGDASLSILMSALPGDEWTDVMSYCNKQWLSSYTYKAIRERIAAENALPDPNAPPAAAPGAAAPGAGGGPVVGGSWPGPGQSTPLGERLVDGVERFAVVALVNLTRETGEITDVFRVRRIHLVAEHPTDRARLRLVDGDGQVLAERTVDVGEFSHRSPGADRVGMVHSYLPVIAGGRRIELSLLGGRLLDVAEKSAEPPRAHSLAVPAGRARRSIAADRHDDTFEVSWKVDHPEPGKVTSSVQVSEDGGDSWRTIAIGLTETTYDFPLHHITDLDHFKVRVIVNDGFDSHTVESKSHRLR